ncbi:MAG: LysM peptidoglycan-binding domain-containing protein [Dehalococcoidia bacterium]|nr:LysM peptidoglycan-binding domain-containing protein [Dehalococcoidia bacterium]
MMHRLPLIILVLGLSLGVLAASCGGGSGDAARQGERVTDPAKVYTSTPIQNPILYQIRQDGQVQTSGGAPAGTVTTGTQTPGANGKSQNYTVVSGDTCSAIATKFGISFDDLKKANRGIDDGCTNLRTGDILKIPAAPTAAPTTSGGLTAGATPKSSGKTYTVASGDTCGGIAQSYNVKVQDLISANGLDADCTSLKIGQVLRIP